MMPGCPKFYLLALPNASETYCFAFPDPKIGGGSLTSTQPQPVEPRGGGALPCYAISKKKSLPCLSWRA